MNTSLAYTIAKSLEDVSAWELTRVEVRSAGIVFCCRYKASGSFVELFYQVDERRTSCIPIQVGGGIYQRDLDQLVDIGEHVILPHIRADIFCHRLGISRDVVSDEVMEILFPYLGKEGLRRLLSVYSFAQLEELASDVCKVCVRYLMWLDAQGEHISCEWTQIFRLTKEHVEYLWEETRLVTWVEREVIDRCCKKLLSGCEEMEGAWVLYCVSPVLVASTYGFSKEQYIERLCAWLQMKCEKKLLVQERLEILENVRGVGIVVHELEIFEEFEEGKDMARIALLFASSSTSTLFGALVDFLRQFVRYGKRYYRFSLNGILLYTCVLHDPKYIASVLDSKPYEWFEKGIVDTQYLKTISSSYLLDAAKDSLTEEFFLLLRRELETLGSVTELTLHRFDVDHEHLGYTAYINQKKVYVNYISPSRGGIYEIQGIIDKISLFQTEQYIPVRLFDKRYPSIVVSYGRASFYFMVYAYIEYEPFIYHDASHRQLLLETLGRLHTYKEAEEKLFSFHDKTRIFLEDELQMCMEIEQKSYYIPYVWSHNDLHQGNIGIRSGECMLIDLPAIVEMSIPEVLAQILYQLLRAGVVYEEVEQTLRMYVAANNLFQEFLKKDEDDYYRCIWLFLKKKVCIRVYTFELPEEWSDWKKLRTFFHGIICEE